MRIVFLGAGSTTVATALLLINHHHEVIIVEKCEARIRELSEHLDCGFLHGDGTRPDVLKQTNPETIDIMLCLAGMDQENILASLVGRTLKIPRIITKLEDPEFEAVAEALGLETVVVPLRTVSRHLADLVEGRDSLELSALIKDDVRLFGFVVQAPQQGSIDKLNLPEDARITWLYRNGQIMFAEPTLNLQEGDEVVVLARSEIAATLHGRLTAPVTD